MTHVGSVLYSQGNRIEFLETAGTTNGARVTVRAVYAPHGTYPPAHLHPSQTETFTVVQGELRVRMHGQDRTYKAGETFRVPPRVPHAMCNASGAPAVVNWTVEPALRREAFFEALYVETRDGRGRSSGLKGLLWRAGLLWRFRDEVTLAWGRRIHPHGERPKAVRPS
ncbi:cupin domain-containing protein [Deinococcus yavapaiensis]|uniref:Quercetin dioxygenase-like cupin family protein n=1 Tax=Deinococcus yavapaiensis KR-236 TaxID=694435 RepID=A0A318SDQ2_9DEIO|nr:cupin domain-containing protein [Deinococcus yavapaiensis]PYE50538.1 quercetin dioxygenase-like cupin family protein [Deinococcus yavapaiensis KR-236]